MKICKQCKIELITRDQKLFCSRSCAVRFNNTKRVRSEESKIKTSAHMRVLYSQGKLGITPTNHHSRKGIQNKIKTESSKPYYECHFCHTVFRRTKYGQKCCSVDCRDSIRARNKCAKVRIFYFNKNENREVYLQSSFEKHIATWLDDNNIVWTHPTKRLHWFDITNQKWRTYLPDFYIPSIDRWLDVKNKFKMESDSDKIHQLCNLFPLDVGGIEYIKETILKRLGTR